MTKDFPAYDQQIDKLVNEKGLGQCLKALVLYRNCCAHGEGLFSHKVYSDAPDTPLHASLGISKNGEQYAMGKRDLLGASSITAETLLGRRH